MKETADRYNIEATLNPAVNAVAAGSDNIRLGVSIGYNTVANGNEGESIRDNRRGPVADFNYYQTVRFKGLSLSKVPLVFPAEQCALFPLFRPMLVNKSGLRT
jgi:hypothetical protein